LNRDFFPTFETFLAGTEKEDRVFLGGCAYLGGEKRERFAAACCGMANGNGGWVVFGAEYLGREDEKDIFAVEGVVDSALLEHELRAFLRDEDWLSAGPVVSFHSMSGRSISGSAFSFHEPSGKSRTLLAVKIDTADWFLRPVCVGAGFLRCAGISSDASFRAVYRRIEGNDVMSGLGVRFRMALDALEQTRDDRPVPGLSVRDLDIESAVSFRSAVLARHSQWANLSEIDFLKRVLVLDDDGKVTLAGQLLLGASLKSSENGAPLLLTQKKGTQKETRFAPNLWSACSDILPELREPLVEDCANAVHECFMNAILHADYDAGRVEIDLDWNSESDKDKREEPEEGILKERMKEGFIRFSNPGLPRGREAGSARNYRLLRIFRLAGLVRELHETRNIREFREKRGNVAEKRAGGLEIIRAWDENFHLNWDTFELFTHAELRLERARESEVVETSVVETSVLETSCGWPVVEEDSVSSEEIFSRRNSLLDFKRVAPLFSHILLTSSDSKEAGEPKIVEPEIVEPEGNGAESPKDEEDLRDEAYLKDEEYSKDKEEYLDEDEEAGFIPEFASLGELVRTTPRLQPSIVREAILELCEEYKSLPELAAALARSEASLRRHYISAMVREGLLEMEFPEKVGHPAQRYRAAGRQESLEE
jgi:predicted HTH transcriptional regulator